ncbi:MAG: hypothetical protein IJC07_01055 [Clostridia bacterium]|nr:hypothetical protein [Clostridia bacterium]
MDFSSISNWGGIFLIAVLLAGMMVATMLKNNIPFLKKSLIPTSVLGGITILLISELCGLIFGENLFDMAIFGVGLNEKKEIVSKGYANLEIITYHCLALGFIGSSFKIAEKKITKERAGEVFNTGVTTVSTYLIQAVLGLTVTIIAASIVTGIFPASGVLLCLGFGQGTGQAMTWGTNYQKDFGFANGTNFGLTIAAMGFLCASIGGVIHLNILKRKGKLPLRKSRDGLNSEAVESHGEIPMQGGMDKLTVQIALIVIAYVLTYAIMFGLSALLPGMKSTIFGFNFLIGVLSATLIKTILQFLRKKKVVKKQYINNFLMTRVGNFFYDLMVVAGISAIRLDLLTDYWGVIAILSVVGLVSTYVYNRIVAKTLFKGYKEEQFLAMYGMLTGTASTGMILLREIDGDFITPVADNLVYQNFPAIVFGLPIMLLFPFAARQPLVTMFILLGFLLVMNVILFRKQIFRRRKKAK